MTATELSYALLEERLTEQELRSGEGFVAESVPRDPDGGPGISS